MVHEPLLSHLQPDKSSPTQRTKHNFIKLGNKCTIDVVMDVDVSACEPTLSVHTTDPRDGLCFLHWIVARQCGRIWCVWPWTGSLCAKHHFRFLRLPAAVHSSIRTLPPSEGDAPKNNAWTHVMPLNTKNNPNPGTRNGKISFFGQGQPVHFEFFHYSEPHYFPFPPSH